MRKGNATVKRFVCLLLACAATAFSACSFALSVNDSSPVTSSSQQGESISQSQTDGSSEHSQENSSSSSQNSEEHTSAKEPDGTKTLLRVETDGIGHKIAYYSDGTREDLGRAVPIDFTPKAPATQYAYKQLAKTDNGNALCAFYEQLYAVNLAVFNGNEDITANDNGDFVVAEVEYASLGVTRAQALSVWKNFRIDYPEFFFLDSRIKHSDSILYLMTDGECALAENRRALWQGICDDVSACDSYINSITTETERALTIYEYLADTLSYAYEEDGKTPVEDLWAHSLAGVVKDKGVCETYTKAFDYYCGLFGLQSIAVVGGAGKTAAGFGGHAWNMVYLSGEWHTVDATWGDQDAVLWREWFGKNGADFKTTHIAQTPVEEWGINYLVSLPEIADYDLCPVKWRKNDGEGQMENTVDKALRKMTDEGGRYELILYPKTAVTEKSEMIVYPEGASFSYALPKVSALKIKGCSEKAESGYYFAKLTAKTPIALRCDLTMENVTLVVPSFADNKYAVIRQGLRSEIKIERKSV